jgi:outer membrane protein OmpA-like peptidoglycan-associated protein
MRPANYLFCLLPTALLGLGCSAQNSQLAACQAEKEQLLATIRSQRDASRDLEQQAASLEKRLDQAEKELARSGGGTRISSRPSETPPAVKAESLPWRSPPAKAEPKTPPAESRRTSQVESASSGALLALARRDRRFHYDAAARAAKMDLPISFDDKTATLTAEDKQQLDDVARLLKSKESRDLLITVAGAADATRAQAVADYLDRHGIAQERLADTGSGSRTGSDRPSAGGVQIYLREPEAPVAGWERTAAPVRR